MILEFPQIAAVPRQKTVQANHALSAAHVVGRILADARQRIVGSLFDHHRQGAIEGLPFGVGKRDLIASHADQRALFPASAARSGWRRQAPVSRRSEDLLVVGQLLDNLSAGSSQSPPLSDRQLIERSCEDMKRFPRPTLWCANPGGLAGSLPHCEPLPNNRYVNAYFVPLSLEL